jgi:hypothetical protein
VDISACAGTGYPGRGTVGDMKSVDRPALTLGMAVELV